MANAAYRHVQLVGNLRYVSPSILRKDRYYAESGLVGQRLEDSDKRFQIITVFTQLGIKSRHNLTHIITFEQVLECFVVNKDCFRAVIDDFPSVTLLISTRNNYVDSRGSFNRWDYFATVTLLNRESVCCVKDTTWSKPHTLQ